MDSDGRITRIIMFKLCFICLKRLKKDNENFTMFWNSRFEWYQYPKTKILFITQYRLVFVQSNLRFV